MVWYFPEINFHVVAVRTPFANFWGKNVSKNVFLMVFA